MDNELHIEDRAISGKRVWGLLRVIPFMVLLQMKKLWDFLKFVLFFNILILALKRF